jgi:hypothetical protein
MLYFEFFGWVGMVPGKRWNTSEQRKGENESLTGFKCLIPRVQPAHSFNLCGKRFSVKTFEKQAFALDFRQVRGQGSHNHTPRRLEHCHPMRNRSAPDFAISRARTISAISGEVSVISPHLLNCAQPEIL